MITVTIGEIVTQAAAYQPGPCVYCARDGDLVLYVGKSIYNASDRILEHIGLLGRGGKSSLGRLITDNWPDSKAWQVDAYTLEDCRPYVTKHFPAYVRYDLDAAEQALIYEHGPCLNVIHNLNNPARKKLPDKYRRDEIIDMAAMLGLGDGEQ